MGSVQLTQHDLQFLAWDLETVAIFHPQPLSVSVDGFQPFTVGMGLGGFSTSIFTRGDRCTACGACCSHRRTWFWHDLENHAEDALPIDVVISGVKQRFWYHVTSSGNPLDGCDYLMPGVRGTPMGGPCRLHVPGLKPLHCRMDPYMFTHKVRLSEGRQVRLLSRKLPSRNWAWPKCPVDIYHEPFTAETLQNDYRAFDDLERNYAGLPGSDMHAWLTVWRETVSHGIVPDRNILFSDPSTWLH